jgi:hypothetical protein
MSRHLTQAERLHLALRQQEQITANKGRMRLSQVVFMPRYALVARRRCINGFSPFWQGCKNKRTSLAWGTQARGALMASAFNSEELWQIGGFVLAALLAAAILSPILLRAWRRQQAIRLKISEPRPIIGAREFTDAIDIGNFGELLVSLWLAKEGWKKLPSKTGAGGQGLDGLFLRERRRGRGVEVLAIEVKTNQAQFRPEQMTDERVRRTIEQLYEIGQLEEGVATTLIRALDRRSRHFRKQFWNPNLETARIEFCDLDAKGNRGRCTVLKATARFVEALALGMRQFDHRRQYIDEMRARSAS